MQDKKSPKERTELRLPALLKEKLRNKARMKGVSLNSYIIDVLWVDVGGIPNEEN